MGRHTRLLDSFFLCFQRSRSLARWKKKTSEFNESDAHPLVFALVLVQVASVSDCVAFFFHSPNECAFVQTQLVTPHTLFPGSRRWDFPPSPGDMGTLHLLGRRICKVKLIPTEGASRMYIRPTAGPAVTSGSVFRRAHQRSIKAPRTDKPGDYPDYTATMYPHVRDLRVDGNDSRGRESEL